MRPSRRDGQPTTESNPRYRRTRTPTSAHTDRTTRNAEGVGNPQVPAGETVSPILRGRPTRRSVHRWTPHPVRTAWWVFNSGAEDWFSSEPYRRRDGIAVIARRAARTLTTTTAASAADGADFAVDVRGGADPLPARGVLFRNRGAADNVMRAAGSSRSDRAAPGSCRAGSVDPDPSAARCRTRRGHRPPRDRAARPWRTSTGSRARTRRLVP